MKTSSIITVLMIAVITFSCQDDEPIPFEPFKDMTKIVSSSLGFDAYKMDVYMNEGPFVGFNYMYVDLYDTITGEKAKDWEVTFAPLMTMMMNGSTIKHTCPVEQPSFDTELQAFFGASVFIMPTTDMGNWEFKVNYKNTEGEGNLTFGLNVVEKSDPALLSFVADHNPDLKYFIALINPRNPDVGINNFELGIYMKESMMSFPAVDNLSIAIAPEMPSMDHGSPDNVNPITIGNGHYKGSVNFTMTGLWHVNMVIEEGANMIAADKYFVIEF